MTNHSKGNSIFRGTALVLVANGIGGVVLLVANLLLARIFSVETYGAYKIIISFFTFLFAIADLGINLTLIRYVSQYRSSGQQKQINNLLRSMCMVKLWSHGIIILISLLGYSLISQLLFKDQSLGSAVATGALILLFSLFETPKILSLAFGRYTEFSLSTFLTFASSGLLTILGAYLGGLNGSIVGFSLGYAVGNAPSTWFMLRQGLLRRNEEIVPARQIFKNFSLPIFATVIPNSLGNAYIPILSPWFSRIQIGYYGFALSFFSGIYLLLQSLYQIVLSQSAGAENNQQQNLLAKTLKAYSVIAVLGATGIVVIAKPLISYVNIAYLPGISIFRWFLSASLILGFLVVLSGYWSGRGRITKALLALSTYSLLILSISYSLLRLTS